MGSSAKDLKGSAIIKSKWMYGCIILSWVFCIFYFNPRLLSVVDSTDSLVARIVYYVFVLFLNLFWLYGIYHLFFLIFKSAGSGLRYAVRDDSEIPRVAILYTTRNDFQEKAARSCLDQTYSNFHVFILDDSTDNTFKCAVDDFHTAYGKKTTVIRREDRKGFKAGNLNNALKHHVVDYDYFAVVDADEVLPMEFLEKLIPYFSLDESIAFVQARHAHNPCQPSAFASNLSLGINFHWDVYQAPRNVYGFVIFYGHGGVIRRDVWEKVGGFPEIVSEDLAFSTRIRQFGYRGYFAGEVTCLEDFPETYHQFRKRYEKWVKGACEFLHRESLPFFLSKKVTLPEKLDVFFSCMSLFIPALFLIYIFTANAILPMLIADKHVLTVVIFGKSFELMPVYFMEPRFKELWTFDFYIMTFISMFSPIFCYFLKIFSYRKNLVRLLFKSAVPYISLILVSACGLMTYLFTRRAVFAVTGDKTEGELPSPWDDRAGFIGRLTSNHPLVFHLEWILGLILTYFALKTLNFALLTISSCLILSPVIARYGWERRSVSVLVSLPLLFVLLTFGSMGMGILGVQGFSLFFLTMHF
jgi:cellulose synthase/poly-beta-1,6-N-acetylglucosamine synthase-like glycosyltransferase